MTNRISKYDQSVVAKYLDQHLSSATGSHIRAKLQVLDQRLAAVEASGEPVVVSLGENCGVADRMRHLQLRPMGSSFFDNLVIQHADMARLIAKEFRGLMQLKNLTIAKWEGHDSVYDIEDKLFYHHYFVLDAPHQKGWSTVNPWWRIIDETDIPLFYSIVRSQFEYLADKFLVIARSNARKQYLIREVQGKPLMSADISLINDALLKIGAKNFRLDVVYSQSEPLEDATADHHCILERNGGDRWGEIEDWRSLMGRLR